jgi:glycosyltransferase involved in cell wall biosynthesis
VALPASFPFPDTATRAAAAAAFAALPDGALALADGLAFGTLPEVATAEARRLRLVALVHHPLGDEAGLSGTERASLLASETAALAASAAVICTSHATASRLADLGVPAERIVVAPPGVDPAPRTLGDGDPPRIVAIGSLIPRKRHDVLIDALSRLAGRAWGARIIGSDRLDPACAAALARRIADAGLTRRITLVGAVVDTRAELAVADIFALASEYEGYGMAFAEDLAGRRSQVILECVFAGNHDSSSR